MMTKKRKSEELKSETKKPKMVNFALSAPEAKNVSLTGDFNSWDIHSHTLKKNFKGTWEININLNPGRYEYRFLVDGEWRNDPNCTTCVPNPFGTKNCILTLK